LIAAMHTSALAGQWTETATLNARFHQTVVRIADNRLLHKFWQSLHPLGWLLAPTISPHKPHDPDDLRARHQALLDALQAGDPDQAEAAFHQHVLQTAHQVRQRLGQSNPTSRPAATTGPLAPGSPMAVP
jgi:DNA-binding GntR family transcriptional regulator